MKRKSWIRRLAAGAVLLLLLLPLLLFGLSNAFLMSPPGRNFIAGRIGGRIGLETKLQGSSWSPWNGISLYGLRIAQPEPLKKALSAPLLAVESIRVMPGWRELGRRQLLIRELDIHRPELTLPIELLSQIPPPQPPPGAPPPQVAAVPESPVTELTPTQTPPPAVASAAASPVPAPNLGAVPRLAPVPTVASNPLPEITVPTVWMNFSDARLKVVTSMTAEPLYEIGKATGKLPLNGKAADTELALETIRTLGNTLSDELTVPVEWRPPVLKFGAVKGGFFGLDCTMEAQFRYYPGMPFVINAVIPRQDNKEVAIGETVQAELGSVAGEARFQGFLKSPASWQGQSMAQAAEIDTRYSGQEASFELGQALFSFQNGALRCLDARLLGESLSILGNAALLTDGRVAANARVVAAPDTLVAVSKMTQPDSAPYLTPLSTPQRAALDLQFYGRPGAFYFRPNPRAAPLLIK